MHSNNFPHFSMRHSAGAGSKKSDASKPPSPCEGGGERGAPLSLACDAAVAARGEELRGQPHRVDGSGVGGRGVPQSPSAAGATAAAVAAVTSIAHVLDERLRGGVPGHVASAVGARARRLDAQRGIPRVARPSDRALVATAAAARRLAAGAARGLHGAVPGIAWAPRRQPAVRIGARIPKARPLTHRIAQGLAAPIASLDDSVGVAAPPTRAVAAPAGAVAAAAPLPVAVAPLELPLAPLAAGGGAPGAAPRAKRAARGRAAAAALWGARAGVAHPVRLSHAVRRLEPLVGPIVFLLAWRPARDRRYGA